MQRRTFIGTTIGIAGLGVLGSNTAMGNSNGLVNAVETSDGGIVATDDDFVISGQEITVDSGSPPYVIHNDGYSGEITDNHIEVEEVPENPTFGIRVDGGDVDATENTVDGDDALARQFLSIGYANEATGAVQSNTLNGGHRVAILATGGGTNVDISENEITGLGAKSNGWAENGIQIGGGATARIRGNTVADHWWDLDDFQSSGIILYQPGDSVNIQRNSVTDNDAGIALWGGNRHNVLHNTIEVTEEDPGDDDAFHAGVFALETTNSGVRQNTITAVDGDMGIVLYPSAENTKLIRNAISGWAEPIVDKGEETKLPKPFDPNTS
jgi:hypothetical protein